MDHSEFVQRWREGSLKVAIPDALIRAAMRHPTIIPKARRVAYVFWDIISSLLLLAIIPLWIWMGWIWGVGSLVLMYFVFSGNKQSGKEFILETIIEDWNAYLVLKDLLQIVPVETTKTDTQ